MKTTRFELQSDPAGLRFDKPKGRPKLYFRFNFNLHWSQMGSVPKFSHHFVSLAHRQKKLAFARKLRENQTNAERLLWNELRGRRFGFRWRRQRLILGWIADFWCAQFNLVIELDGEYHSSPEQQARDKYRDQVMRDRGVKILRFTNAEVETDIHRVLEAIGRTVSAFCGSREYFIVVFALIKRRIHGNFLMGWPEDRTAFASLQWLDRFEDLGTEPSPDIFARPIAFELFPGHFGVPESRLYSK